MYTVPFKLIRYEIPQHPNVIPICPIFDLRKGDYRTVALRYALNPKLYWDLSGPRITQPQGCHNLAKYTNLITPKC